MKTYVDEDDSIKQLRIGGDIARILFRWLYKEDPCLNQKLCKLQYPVCR